MNLRAAASLACRYFEIDLENFEAWLAAQTPEFRLEVRARLLVLRLERVVTAFEAAVARLEYRSDCLEEQVKAQPVEY